MTKKYVKSFALFSDEKLINYAVEILMNKLNVTASFDFRVFYSIVSENEDAETVYVIHLAKSKHLRNILPGWEKLNIKSEKDLEDFLGKI